MSFPRHSISKLACVKQYRLSGHIADMRIETRQRLIDSGLQQQKPLYGRNYG
jgi:hypothetical protein